jgi:type I restriction enzyme M protein
VNKQQLANKIWESANKMRSKIEANEYKDYILGFIFYKFLSDKEVRFIQSKGATAEEIKNLSEEDTETVKYIQGNIGYFIAYKDLLSSWLSMGKDFDVSNVRDALSAFNRLIDSNYKKVFDGIFETLQTGLSKLGESSGSQTKAISDLIQLIKDIPMDGKQDYDVLGFIYEYLISNFAANAGKKAGEFYTPQEETLYDLAELFKVFGDSTRIKILWALDEAEMCVCDIAFLLNMTQSAISHQLRVLKQAELVKSRREGKIVFYSLEDEHVKQIFDQGLIHISEESK